MIENTKSMPGNTAKIYQFPDLRRRRDQERTAAVVPEGNFIDWRGGWYHAEAIESEHSKAADPAA